MSLMLRRPLWVLSVGVTLLAVIIIAPVATASPVNLSAAQVDTNPYGAPNLIPMFDGTTLNGWTASKSGGWVVKNKAIHGTGTAGRGWIYYNKKQVGSFRWIFNVRQVKGNHAPTVLIWGTVKPLRDALSAIQFQPPNGGHWDYRPGRNDSGGSKFKKLSRTRIDVHQWSQCEIVANQETGVARMACCPLSEGALTCKAVETLTFKDRTASRVGPLAIQIHNKGIQDEYKSLYLDPAVEDPDNFITTSL
jgi:3-keto-disaccharide hydrolase